MHIKRVIISVMGFICFESYSASVLKDSDALSPVAALHSMKCILYS